MRICAFCGNDCDSQIGLAREVVTTYWGGKRRGVEYSAKVVSFFCDEDHRNEYLASGSTTGQIQTGRWRYSGPE